MQELYVFDLGGPHLRVNPVNNNNDSADLEILKAAKTLSGEYNNEKVVLTDSWKLAVGNNSFTGNYKIHFQSSKHYLRVYQPQ